MSSYGNNRSKTFEELREKRKQYGYPDGLLENLAGGDLICLNDINIADRNNKAYMEPLLFAVKNDESNAYTYEVFQFYGVGLQKQELQTLAAEIAEEAPEVLKGTDISDDATSVIYLASINPKIILYISDDLIKDGEFIEELCERCGKEAIQYAIEACNIEQVLQDNPDLANNPEFMKEAIKEDASILKYANEELKNDYEFMRDVTKSNRETIDYVVEHTDEFGKNALNGAKDSLEEELLAETKNAVKDVRVKLETEKDKLTPEQIDRKERDLESINKWIKRFEEAETPEKKGRIAHLILTTTGMEQYKNMDMYSNGVAHEKMDPEFRKELEKYEKLYIAAKEKERAEKENAKETTQEKSGYTIGHDAIESVVGDSTPSKMNGQSKIMEGILEEEKTKDSMEVTKDDKEPNGERQ